MLGLCYVINWNGKETLKVRFYKKKPYKNLRHDISKRRDDL